MLFWILFFTCILIRCNGCPIDEDIKIREKRQIDNAQIDPLIPDRPDEDIGKFVIPPLVKNRIKTNCRRKSCKGQHPDKQQFRAAFKELRSKSLQKGGGKGKGKKNKNDADALVEANFQKVFRLKQKYYRIWGILDEADPADDGLYGGDMILSERQLDQLMRSLEALENLINLHPDQRGRRSAMYFEDPQYEVQLWTMPIPYFVDIDSGITSDQRNLIKTALSEITTGTGGRIRFTELIDRIDGAYIDFVATQTTGICGASTIGRQDSDNSIYLNFNCATIYGTILHETMHVLGCAHQHTRLDRQIFLTVNWDNIQEYCYDQFALNDMEIFTSYGTQYSYGSVMHYGSKVCAIDKTVSTLIPTGQVPNGVVMGQRTRLSAADIDLLNRIYCCGGGTTPAKCSCKDNSPYCGYDANVGFCTDQRYTTWMRMNCRKSCNLCNC